MSNLIDLVSVIFFFIHFISTVIQLHFQFGGDLSSSQSAS